MSWSLATVSAARPSSTLFSTSPAARLEMSRSSLVIGLHLQ
jgi:hypothetical protein